MTTIAPPREQTRARYPDATGYVERDGVRVFWERYGDHEPTILLLPTWSIVHSRCWKLQIPYLARHCRVVTFDPRGNGRSDRPADPAAYAETEFAADALAVLDATDTAAAVIVGFSAGAQRALILAAEQAERVQAAVFVGPALPIGPQTARANAMLSFDQRLEVYEGWEKHNRHYWLQHYPEFLEFFFSQVFNEPHSTKQREDAVAWALETTPEALIATVDEPGLGVESTTAMAARVACPVLVVHGSDDQLRSPEGGAMLADLTGATFVSLDGCGHAPHVRDPVRFNLLLRDFACRPWRPNARS